MSEEPRPNPVFQAYQATLFAMAYDKWNKARLVPMISNEHVMYDEAAMIQREKNLYPTITTFVRKLRTRPLNKYKAFYYDKMQMFRECNNNFESNNNY